METSIIFARGMDALRMILCSLVNAFVFFYLMRRIFEQKRPRYLWLAYTLFKQIFVIGFCFSIAYDWIQQSKWLYLSYNVFIMMQGILLAIVLILTFRGNPVKIVMLSMLVESIAIVIGISAITIVNLIEGRDVKSLYIGRVEPLDLLVPVFAILLYQIVCKAGKKLFQKLREYELKYTRVWGGLCIAYWASGALSHQLQSSQVSSFYYMEQVLFMFFEVAVFFLVIALYMYSLWEKQALRKNNYLEKQKELIESHIHAVQNQVRWMEQSRKEMNAQMKEILELDCDAEKNQRFSMYLTQLKEQYQNMKAGVYCGDSLVDSVLYFFVQHFSEKDISYEFSFQSYQSKRMASEDVSELVFQLLNLVKTGPIVLKTQVVSNMLCFEFQCPGVKRKMLQKVLEPLVQKYQVEIWQDKKGKENPFLICIKMSKIIKKE